MMVLVDTDSAATGEDYWSKIGLAYETGLLTAELAIVGFEVPAAAAGIGVGSDFVLGLWIAAAAAAAGTVAVVGTALGLPEHIAAVVVAAAAAPSTFHWSFSGVLVSELVALSGHRISEHSGGAKRARIR